MIDVKLCKNCRPVLEREREARFFRVEYFSLWQMWTKSLRRKQPDIISRISRYVKKNGQIFSIIDVISKKYIYVI